jgi:transcriptional regulator with XRE-family HTH domain
MGTYHVNLFLVYFSGVATSRPEIVGSSAVRLLRRERERLGLSMNAVAKRAGLSHSMVSRVEHELRKPTLDTLLRISGAMGIEIWPLIQKSEATVPIVKQKSQSR